MISKHPIISGLMLLVTLSPAAAQQAHMSREAGPVARVVAKVDTLHGEVRVDNYFWLRDRKNPDVISYLEAENQYTDAAMADTKELQKKLYDELLGRIQQTDLTVPDRIGDYYYYTRTVQGQQYSIFARKKGSLDAVEEVLLDRNELAKGKRYFSTGAVQVSPDHNMLAFTTDTTGAEYYTLHFKDLRTGQVAADRVDSAHFALAWATDNRTVFYSKTDAAQRPDRIMRHTIGTDSKQDALIFHEPDVLYRVNVSRSKDNAFVFVTTGSFTSSEVRFAPANQPTTEFKLIEPRTRDMVYSVTHQHGNFLIRTNADGATNFKVMQAPPASPGRRNWTNLFAHRDAVFIDGMDVFESHIVLFERKDALRAIRVVDLNGGAEHYIDFPEQVYSAFAASNPDYRASKLRFNYTSLVTPSSVFDYDMRTRKRELKKQTAVLGGYDPTQYETERAWARASDGATVPVSIVYKKPLVKDGQRPLLLYAYGSYGSSTDPSFSSNNLSLLDRGVIYAIAHIRGGQEMGRAWYDQGKMLNKKNTFTDFIASAEHLIKQGYTSSDKLAIRGGSAGGLLMGAVVNMRPDLFKVVIADVPFVDVINTMLDASIPLTAGEWEQWGNPAVQEHYEYMKTYSPYDNVARKPYPIMLVTTGLNDPRVAYWEPAKWVARLRAFKTDSNPLLLKTNMGAGHGGSSGRYDALREQAFRYAFILKGLGVREPVL